MKLNITPAELATFIHEAAKRICQNSYKKGQESFVEAILKQEFYEARKADSGVPKPKICPECGSECDGKRMHKAPTGQDCYMVCGRRGWRQLGVYDG